MSRAMSAARRYSARLVMIASPKGGEAVWTDRIRGAAQSLRARLAAPRGARDRPARLRPGWHFSWYLDEPEPCPPEHGSQGGQPRNGAIESIIVGADRPFGCP